MLELIVQTIAKHTIGYAIRWYRSGLKVSVETHIEQSLSERKINVSITNDGMTPIIVDSWTVHMPLKDLLPGVAKREDKTEPPQPRLKTVIRRVTVPISRLLNRRNHIANMNKLSQLMARSMLTELHWRHELLESGARQRIEAGESAVRSFPRTSAVGQMPTIDLKTHFITIIPSCRIVGHRRRIWGLPSYLSLAGAAQFTKPGTDDDEF